MSNNPNKIISLQELINAQVDAYKLELIMNEAPWVEIETRLGRTCYSILTIQAVIEQFQLDTQAALNDLQEAINTIIEGEVPDLIVTTWTGKTQREENKAFITSVENYSDLDDLEAEDGRVVYLTSPTIAGQFKYVETSLKIHDGGTIIEDSQGRIWERLGFFTICPLWFGAVGDGVTDDTSVFDSIEQNFTEQVVDLNGRTYVVDVLPVNNQYLNGVLKTSEESKDLNFLLTTNRNELLLKANNTIQVKHFRQNGLIYDVVSNIKPFQLGMVSNRVDDITPVMSRKTAKEASTFYNVPVVINSIAFKNADGTSGWDNALLVPNGIYIENATVVSNWESAGNIDRNQAVCLMKNGRLQRFYRGETTAQAMVEQGAIWGFSWGAFCVFDGEIPADLSSHPIGGSTLSARTILCQKEDGTLFFVLIEGVSGTYGATSEQAGELAISLGAKIAFVCDGGGSTQCYWGGAYAVPSSDTVTRSLSSYFIVNTPAVQPYDSGVISIAYNTDFSGEVVDSSKPPLYIRQIHDSVALNVNFNEPLPSGTVNITDGKSLPIRYNASNSSVTRNVCSGGGGKLFNISQGGGANLGTFTASATNQADRPTSIVGQCYWYTKHI